MAYLNTFAERFRLGRPSASPFASLTGQTGVPSTKLEWCPTCHDETDTETQAHHQGTTYSYKRWCVRCGHVLARGIYHNVPILSDVPLPAGTVEWTTAPGMDRR